MKTMTCKELGGACDKKFSADTFDEIVVLSKQHGVEMFQQKDVDHLKAMEEMQALMQSSIVMQEWIEAKRKAFDELS